MKKFIAVLLIFLLSMTSVAAIAEVDLSSYTEADLRALRTQIDRAIAKRSNDEGKAEAVCNAFIQCMQELGHSLEITSVSDRGLFYLMDTQLDSEKFVFLVNAGYDIVPPDNFAASNQDYIRDCMVAMAMAVARVEGVKIFSDDIDIAMYYCMSSFPDSSFSDNIDILWDNNYGYRWIIRSNEGITLIGVH